MVFQSDPKRDATASIRGYVYQIYQSVLQWIQLKEDEVLLLESAEDFDVFCGSAVTATQVKDVKGNLTLRSASVTDTLNNFWTHKETNPDYRVILRFLTTATAGEEKNSPFGKGTKGLLYWSDALSNDVDISPLRKFLLTLQLNKDLSMFIKNSTGEELRKGLISCIKWDLGNKSKKELEIVIQEKLKIHGYNFRINPSESSRALYGLVKHVVDILAVEGYKRLTFGDFLTCFEEATMITIPRGQIEVTAANKNFVGLSLPTNSDFKPTELRVYKDISGQVVKVNNCKSVKQRPIINQSTAAFLNDRQVDVKKKVITLLSSKFESDVLNSLFNEPEYIEKKTRQILDNLKITAIYNQKSRRFSDIDKHWTASVAKLQGKPQFEIAKKVAHISPIRIDATSIVTLACAATLSLAKRYRESGLDIEFDCKYQNGVKLINSLTIKEPDFLIAPVDPLVLGDDSTTKNYRFIVPLVTEYQHIFYKKGKPRADSRIYAYDRSSAEFHFRLNTGIPPNVKIKTFEEIEFMATKGLKIREGDFIIAWEPLANLYDESALFIKEEKATHEILFGLFCKDEWLKPHMKNSLEQFVLLFLNEMKYCALVGFNAMETLKESYAFMNGFAAGAGIHGTVLR